MKKQLAAIAISVAMVLPSFVLATSHAPASAGSQAAPHVLTEGEVRRIDKDAKKLTIRHGPIHSLDMPPMTMVFRVQDPTMLEAVKPGEKIKFAAERIDGTYTVTKIETAK